MRDLRNYKQDLINYQNDRGAYVTYQMMFYGGLIGVSLTLPLVIFLFIRLRIIEVFEDITGLRVRKKTREQMDLYHLQTSGSLRQTSESIRIRKQYTTGTNTSQSASLKPIAVEYAQAQTAASAQAKSSLISGEGHRVKSPKEPDETAYLNEFDETELLEETGETNSSQLETNDETALLSNEDHDETALLEDEIDETAILDEEIDETTWLNGETDETMLLEDADETTLLTDDETVLLDETEDDFILQKNIIIVHSNHIIGKEREHGRDDFKV